MTATKQVIKFNQDRNLTTFNGTVLYSMLEEELNELLIAIHSNDQHETIDALNDLRVLAEGGLWQLGQDPELSLQQTCKEILSRQGSLNPTTGKWTKDPNQAPSTLYKADYTLSEL